MSLQSPHYQMLNYCKGTFSEKKLQEILAVLPLRVEVAEGHELSLKPRSEYGKNIHSTLMVDYSGAQLIKLSPPTGMRLADAAMSGRFANEFMISRIMDEVTGGGACCSFFSNTKRLGLEYDIDFGFDIHKLG